MSPDPDIVPVYTAIHMKCGLVTKNNFLKKVFISVYLIQDFYSKIKPLWLIKWFNFVSKLEFIAKEIKTFLKNTHQTATRDV